MRGELCVLTLRVCVCGGGGGRKRYINYTEVDLRQC